MAQKKVKPSRLTAPENNNSSKKSFLSAIDRYFKISERSSTWSREIHGGLATFFAMSYIVVLNPLVLGLPQDHDGNSLGVQRVAAATALTAGVITIAMGIWARYPFALAIGVGISAFTATTLSQYASEGLTWPDIMGLITLTSIIMIILVLTKFREAVFRAVPQSIKSAIVVGIGLFITLVGLVNAGFVRRIPDQAGTTVPVGLGFEGKLLGWPTLTFIAGLVLTITLVVRKVKGGILISIIATTIFAIIIQAVAHVPARSDSSGYHPEGWSLVVPELPHDSWISWPDLSLIGNIDIFGAFAHIGPIAATLLTFAILLSCFFDAMGTVVGLATEAKVIDENNNIEGINKVLLVDAAGMTLGGANSVSANQVYVESAAGISEGARTGLASIITGLLFLLAMPFTPLVNIVPFEAVAPALIVVGFMMVSQIRNTDWTDWGNAIPAFLTFTLMPFTYSIANGIGVGFISYVLIRLIQKRGKEVHPLMYGIAAAFILFFGLGVIEQIAGV